MRKTEPHTLASVLDDAGAIIMALLALALVVAFVDAAGRDMPPSKPQPIAEPLDLGLN